MNNQATQLKELLADAVWLGTQLAELNYAKGIHEPESGELRRGIEKLKASAAAFLAEARLSDVHADDVLPLYREIVQGHERRAQCSHETT